MDTIESDPDISKIPPLLRFNLESIIDLSQGGVIDLTEPNDVEYLFTVPPEIPSKSGLAMILKKMRHVTKGNLIIILKGLHG